MKIFPLLYVALILSISSGLPFYTQVHAETLTITAVVVSKGNCSFKNDTATLSFGTLNPLDPKNITADTEQGALSFSCVGNGQNNITYSITVTNSVYGTATNPAMQHEDGIFNLPYELSLDPASGTITKVNGKPPTLPLVVTGKVRGDDYKLAPVGAYLDTATLRITP